MKKGLFAVLASTILGGSLHAADYQWTFADGVQAVARGQYVEGVAITVAGALWAPFDAVENLAAWAEENGIEVEYNYVCDGIPTKGYENDALNDPNENYQRCQTNGR